MTIDISPEPGHWPDAYIAIFQYTEDDVFTKEDFQLIALPVTKKRKALWQRDRAKKFVLP